MSVGAEVVSDVWSQASAFSTEYGDLRLRHMLYSVFLSLLISLLHEDSVNCWLPSLREQHGKIQENT